MTEPKSSNLSVNKKFSRNLPNQVQQLDLKLFWYMEFRSKSRKHSQNDGTHVQQLEINWEIAKKFTKPSPATWFENVLIYGIHVEKPKTKSKWRNPSPATWVWMRNCQEIYQTKSSNLIWKCFDIWNSCRKAENRVEMTEPKSSNLSVNEKLSRKLPNQVQQLDLKMFWHMEFMSKSPKQSWNDGTQVQQLECEWEIVKKFIKLSPATWFENVLTYGIHVEKPKTELKWRNPSPATWVWMRNCQEIYQTKSSNLIWKCFDIWNSCRKAKNTVKMTEPKSSNLSVNEKFKKFTKPSPATWFENVLICGIHVEKPKTELKWRNPSPATWVWMKNCQEIYQTKSSNLIWKYFDIWNSCRKAENKVKMTEPKSSNLSVIEKLSRNLPNQVQQLDLNCFDIWNSGRKAENTVKMTEPKSSNLSVNEKFKKFTKPSPATWFENVLIYGIHVEKPKTKSKWRNPSPAIWV